MKAYWNRKLSNFGDVLAPALVEFATGYCPEWCPRNAGFKLLATGSNLMHVQRGDVVWGAGFYSGNERPSLPAARYQVLRGPLSARAIGHFPAAYGDPVLLLPLLYPRFPVPVGGRQGWVPNVIGHVVNPPRRCDVTVDLTRPWRDVVDMLVTCEVVHTTSLHALAACEAYGIPVVWYPDGGVPRFKFMDYLAGTDRPHHLASGTRPPPIPDLQGIQGRIMRAARVIPSLFAQGVGATGRPDLAPGGG